MRKGNTLLFADRAEARPVCENDDSDVIRTKVEEKVKVSEQK